MYVEAKCSTLMRMPEDKYLKLNLRTSNNREVEFFSCGFYPLANWPPITNLSKWVSHCYCRSSSTLLSPIYVVGHLNLLYAHFGSKLERWREETSLHIWDIQQQHSISDRSWFLLSIELLLQACYMNPGTELTGGRTSQQFLTAMRNNRGHQHSSETSCKGPHILWH